MKNLNAVLYSAAAFAASAAANAGEILNVKIVDRQTSENSYTYVIPGDISTRSNSSANCSGVGNSANCRGTTITTGSVTPARTGSYNVMGATFTLLLPDNRLVVVNCESKFVPFRGRRSCRMPLVENIEAEFSDKKATLTWPVSLDGKKKESEKYDILAILDGA